MAKYRWERCQVTKVEMLGLSKSLPSYPTLTNIATRRARCAPDSVAPGCKEVQLAVNLTIVDVRMSA